MISAEEFLELLREKDLLPDELIEDLRQKVAQSNVPTNEPPWNKPITAARLAKWLVDNGHLSRLLAQRLLARAEQPSETASAPPPKQLKEKRQPKRPDEELGFAPLPEDATRPSGRRPAALSDEAVDGMRRKVTEKPSKKKAEPGAPAAPGGSLLEEELLSAEGLGPLDQLADEAMFEAEDAAAAGPLAQLAPKRKGLFSYFRLKRKFARARKKENVWDSPLLLVGGGALLGLLILGGVLIWAFTRETGDKMFEAANNFYQEGSYSNAISNYNRYLEEFPRHSGASLARVRRGLARLRQATDGARDWPRALGVAKEVLAEIESEEEFNSEARPELAALLPKIAEGLAQQARKELNPSLVELARQEGLALVNEYVPRSLQPTTRIVEMEALLALTEREIARGAELEKATAAMHEAVSQGDTAKAYQIREALLREYPRLVDNEKLKEAILLVSQAEKSKVRMVAQQQAAVTTEPASAVLATVALARRNAEGDATEAKGHVVFAAAQGAVYALDAATGKVLWRRWVGFADNGRSFSFPPTPIADQPNGDVLIVDAVRNEVLRVEAASGQLRWRHPLGERFDAHPVVASDQLLVATRSGRLVIIDLESGNSSGYVELPQSLRVAPTIDSRRSDVYQVAEHSNLFVLSLSDGRAKQVLYIGHEPGSITVPPVLINRFLILAHNDGAKDCALRVLLLDQAEKEPAVRVVQEERLNGHVDSTPLVAGVRLLVVTDQGDIHVFEISGSSAEKPLVRIAEGKAAGKRYFGAHQVPSNLVRFPLMLGGRVWIADSQLTCYDIHPSRGRLEPKWIENEGSATLQPAVGIGQTIFHVRRKVGLPGVVVSACRMDEGQLLWETHLGAPLATDPMIDPQTGRVTAVTSIGAVFQMDSSQMEGQTVIDQPSGALWPTEVRQPITQVVQLAGGLLALAAPRGSKQIPVFDPQEGKKRFHWLAFPDPLDCPPVAFAGGLLAPCELGQVLLLDPRSGKKQTEPFQPRLETGVQVAWREPAIIGNSEFLLADARNKLYRVGIQDNPKPHLAELAEVELSESIVSPIAVVETVAYAVDGAETLLAFKLPDLARGQLWPLGARCVWGPRRIGNRVLLATEDDRLLCLDAQQKLLWKVALPYGPLAGAPLELGGHYVLAAASGVIWRVEAASGEEVAKIDTGYPLATGPVPLGERLLVGGHEGSLYKVEQP